MGVWRDVSRDREAGTDKRALRRFDRFSAEKRKDEQGYRGRAVREQSVICPSALPEANVPELLEKIIKEKAYKQDYDSLTMQLLEENVPYDTVIAALKQIAGGAMFDNTYGG